MILALTQSATAIAAGLTASFLANGGSAPYVYAVLPGGAGGTINPTTGVYTAPAAATSDPASAYDTVQVVDNTLATTTAQILVGTPLLLLCEILQKELGLVQGRVYIWDQKIMQPTDSGLYVAVSVPSCRPFGNVNRVASNGGLESQQFVTMQATVTIDAISRGPAARDQKELIILALGSTYAEQQQEANSFLIGRLPAAGRFINLSEVDGAAIPYRYQISINMQYAVSKSSQVPYFDQFQAAQTTINA